MNIDTRVYEAIRINGSTQLREEALALLPAIQAELRPCGPLAVINALKRLLQVYHVPTKTDHEWEDFWSVYVDALENLPLRLLEDGVRRYVEQPDAQFFPKPGPLLALCRANVPLVYSRLDTPKLVAGVASLGLPSPENDRDRQESWARREYFNLTRSTGLVALPSPKQPAREVLL